MNVTYFIQLFLLTSKQLQKEGTETWNIKPIIPSMQICPLAQTQDSQFVSQRQQSKTAQLLDFVIQTFKVQHRHKKSLSFVIPCFTVILAITKHLNTKVIYYLLLTSPAKFWTTEQTSRHLQHAQICLSCSILLSSFL